MTTSLLYVSTAKCLSFERHDKDTRGERYASGPIVCHRCLGRSNLLICHTSLPLCFLPCDSASLPCKLTSSEPLISMLTDLAGSTTAVANSSASELSATASDSNAVVDRYSGLLSVGCPSVFPDWNKSLVFVLFAPQQSLKHNPERDPLAFPSLTALPNWKHRADASWDLGSKTLQKMV